MRNGLIALALAATAAAPACAMAQTAGPEASAALHAEIRKLDSELFAAAFDRCDIGKLGEMVTDDVEFIHDKWGQTARTRTEFVAGFERTCARQASGEDYRARRELIPESMTVHVLNGYGVMQMGRHRFYKLVPGQPERLVETASFIDIWKKTDGRYRLFRVISYDHRLAE